MNDQDEEMVLFDFCNKDIDKYIWILIKANYFYKSKN